MKKHSKKKLKLQKEIIAKINLSKIVGGNVDDTDHFQLPSRVAGCTGGA